MKVRGDDKWGSGYYKAPRGDRKHNGVDIIITDKGVEISAIQGGIITKIGYPEDPKDCIKGHLRYVEITVPCGCRHRYFYVSRLGGVGDVVSRGDRVGDYQGLDDVYEGITEHVHFEVKLTDGRFIDPVKVIRSLGYEVED